jgi:hypothetical protein
MKHRVSFQRQDTAAAREVRASGRRWRRQLELEPKALEELDDAEPGDDGVEGEGDEDTAEE